jgi:transcriptional regulator with XRE-family HTH domain
VYFENVSFRENLKQELSFNGMLVKELASAAGIHKRALDTYLLSENASIPPADAAVRIAQALGVSVEYLVTGEETGIIPKNARPVIRRFLQLDEKDRQIVSVLIDALLENHGSKR